jgi:Ca2+:H+ antiporter
MGETVPMSDTSTAARLPWTSVVPVVAVLALAATWGRALGPVPVGLVAVLLAAATLAAVHHAEVVAHRVGEPFGSIVLAVAVTIIEVGLIVTLMSSGGDKASTLARDTVFAAAMITCNGIMGLSIFLSAKRFGFSHFNAEGTGGALATIVVLAGMCLVLPSFTLGEPGPQFTGAQLVFAAVASVALYAMFIVTQTRQHRDFFLPVAPDGSILDEDDHATPPTTRHSFVSLGLLVLSLVSVVGLAKVESPAIESGVESLGLPPSFVGVVIALLVLAPETLAAVRAAQRGRVQNSLNLALGSGIASIGLTIPAIAVASIWLDGPLVLGLGATQLVLLALTVVVAVLTIVPGRATRLQGGIHLVLLAAYVFLAAKP